MADLSDGAVVSVSVVRDRLLFAANRTRANVRTERVGHGAARHRQNDNGGEQRL